MMATNCDELVVIVVVKYFCGAGIYLFAVFEKLISQCEADL